MAELIGSTYELEEEIGSGGGGIVYLANHVRLNKKVVLKADKRKITTREDLLRREVDVLKNLSHPYIPKVYDFFTEDDTVYTAMDYIDGESLDKALSRGERFPQPTIIRWARQLLEALEYLHSPTHGDPPRGYVHSDIKPANVMRRMNGDICLIDFNISLALGEENVIGISPGYASPEHYGLDFSSGGYHTGLSRDSTVLVDKDGVTIPTSESKSSLRRKGVTPDVRSDIYSLGATLYHLFSGRRPAKHAKEVQPLTGNDVSQQIAQIINRAMQPNPDDRYQTAAEMLWDFEHLHENDPRTKRLKRRARITAAALAALFLAGGATAFTGLRIIARDEAEDAARQAREKQALELVNTSESAWTAGNVERARDTAMEALKLDTIYNPQAQTALTQALGVYDLGSGYHPLNTCTLAGPALKAGLSPEGSRTWAMYMWKLNIYDTETGALLAELDIEPSALADAVFLDEDRVIYAGSEGITAYSISQAQTLWTGVRATAIARSGDGRRIAAIYKDEPKATIYQADLGEVIAQVDLDGRGQAVDRTEAAIDMEDNILALNQDGTLLGLNLSDGTVAVINPADREQDLELPGLTGYTHFEGGFSGPYFAFSGSGKEGSLFAIIDAQGQSLVGTMENTTPFYVQADETGIYVANETTLVSLDPNTGEQSEVAYIEKDITAFEKGADFTVVAAEDSCSFFSGGAKFIQKTQTQNNCDFAGVAGSYALLASRDSPTLRLMKREDHEEAELFSYDPTYAHSEARLSADRSTVMLFQYDQFRLYSLDGELLTEVEIPDGMTVYDQLYRRDADRSWLEVIYDNGLVRRYSAKDGSILSEEQGEPHEGDIREEFLTDRYRIDAPTKGIPVVYDRESGEKITELQRDDGLTYVTQVGEYIVTEYTTTQTQERYGLLLNENLETLARLPGLCDIWEDTLIFDYPTGNLRQSRIYSIEDLLNLAEQQTKTAQ